MPWSFVQSPPSDTQKLHGERSRYLISVADAVIHEVEPDLLVEPPALIGICILQEPDNAADSVE